MAAAIRDDPENPALSIAEAFVAAGWEHAQIRLIQDMAFSRWPRTAGGRRRPARWSQFRLSPGRARDLGTSLLFQTPCMKPCLETLEGFVLSDQSIPAEPSRRTAVPYAA